MHAYALMQEPCSLDRAYVDSPIYRRASAELEAIRAVLSGVSPASYRGIGRHPLLSIRREALVGRATEPSQLTLNRELAR